MITILSLLRDAVDAFLILSASPNLPAYLSYAGIAIGLLLMISIHFRNNRVKNK